MGLITACSDAVVIASVQVDIIGREIPLIQAIIVGTE